jgi:hypothetical protein
MRGHFESKPVSDGMAFIPRLSLLPCYFFFLAAVKHKRFAADEGEVLSFIHRLFLTSVVFGNVSSIENPSFRTA